MGKANYKRLGDYIQPVDIRNKDLSVDKLVGLTIEKVFIDSVANTIGTDLSKYKIIEAEQFACSLMQVSRDGKMPIAMYEGSEKAILSPAYPMFKVIDKSKLLPSYLMMWFRRSEFDRQASFYAVGGVRGSLSWDDFLDFRLPIPDIEVQREIVAQYETITNRIALNERICSILEETAQALYNKMFVQDIDPDNLPPGWRMGTLDEIAEYLNGLACQKYESYTEDFFPVIKIKELRQGFTDKDSSKVVLDVPNKYIIKNGDVIFSWSATLFADIWHGGEAVLNQHLFKVTSKKYPKWFYLLATKQHINRWTHEISAKATSMGHIKREDLDNAEVVIPNKEFFDKANILFDPILDALGKYKLEMTILRNLSLMFLECSR